MFPAHLSRLTLSAVFLLMPLTACGPNNPSTPDVTSSSRPTSAVGQGIIRGQITATGLNFSTAQTSGMSGVEVYLDGLPDIRTKSSSDGSFELTGVPEGEHFVVAETSTAEGNFKVRQAASVSATTPIADVRSLVLKRTGSISGLVTIADGSGNLLGTDVFIAGSTLVAKAKDNGAYALTNVAEGTYKVTAIRTGFAPVTQTITVVAGRPAQLNLALTERESSASQNSLSGIVQTQTPTGLQPLAGVVISLRGGTSTLSDAEGKYTLASVPAGEHTIQLYKAGYRLHTQTQTVAANSGDTTLPATNLEIESNRALITGTVTDANINPLEGIKVELGSRFVYTDAQGQYRFEDINAGGNTLRFSKGQKGVTPCGNGALFEAVSQDIVAETGKTSQANVTLTEACEVTIAGRIQDFGDSPLAAEVFVEELNRNLSVHPTQGTFRSEPLKTGTYTLVVRRDGYEDLTFRANLSQSVEGITVQLWPRLAGSSDSDGDKILNADEKLGQKLDPTNDSIFPPVYPLEPGGDIDGDGIQNQNDKHPFDSSNDSVEYMGSKLLWPQSPQPITSGGGGGAVAPTPSPSPEPSSLLPTPSEDAEKAESDLP
jgi:hypothetical protein